MATRSSLAQQIRHYIVGAALPLALAFALGACGAPATHSGSSSSTRPNDSAANTSTYRFPSHRAGDYTFSWTALDGVDLTSRAAEVVRAYFESCQLANRMVPELYPGSLTANQSVPFGRFCLRQSSGFGIPFSGTIHARINRLTQTSTTIAANVCIEQIGTYAPPNGNPPFATVRTVSHDLVANKPADVVDPRLNVPHVAPPGKGSRAPAYDAFSPWKMAPEPDPVIPTGPASSQDCAAFSSWVVSQVPAFAGQNPFGNPLRTDGLRRLTPSQRGPEGFPTLPQSPAWPEAR